MPERRIDARSAVFILRRTCRLRVEASQGRGPVMCTGRIWLLVNVIKAASLIEKGTVHLSRVLLVRVPVGLVCLTAIGLAVFLALAWRSAEPAVSPPDPASFAPRLVAQGATLAAVGNCITCHTAAPEKPFAGGRALDTPYGTIYTTNITPDAATGIGTWSPASFRRALREGVDQNGRYLYPAFPYDHFTHLRDGDIDALYAFLMTRRPVHEPAKPNALPFPYNLRVVLAAWDLLFLRRGPVMDDPGKSAAYNRGAYLVEGIGHCGACHTPRNGLGAEDPAKTLAGAELDHWWAPGLGPRAQSPVPWTAAQFYAYLRNGDDRVHGASAGPMQEVTHNLAQAPAADLQAIADYLTSAAPAARETAAVSPAVNLRGTGHPGAILFAGSCAVCHSPKRDIADVGIPLGDATSLHLDTPINFIHLVLDGRHLPDGTSGAFMPGFANVYSDLQIAALADYLRDTNGLALWTGVEAGAHNLRHDGGSP